MVGMEKSVVVSETKMNDKKLVVIVNGEEANPTITVGNESPKKNDKNRVVVNDEEANPSTTLGNEFLKKNDKNRVVVNGEDANQSTAVGNESLKKNDKNIAFVVKGDSFSRHESPKKKLVVVNGDEANPTTTSGNESPKKKLVVVVHGKEANPTTTAGNESPKKKKVIKNRILVSNNKKPLYFYINLAKKHMQMYNDVELTALGMAIPAVITISEFLKRSGLAVEKRITISTFGVKDDKKGRIVEKAQMEIVLGLAKTLNKTGDAVTSNKAVETKA